MELLEESGFCPSTGIYYSKWDSPQLPLSPSLSLPSFLLSHSHPRTLLKPAFVHAKSGKAVTYGETRVLVGAIGAALRARGVGKGDVVLLVAPNSLSFPLLVLGIMSSGAVFSTANPMNTRPEIKTQVEDSKPVLILTTQELKPKMEGLLPTPLLLVQDFLDHVLRTVPGPSSSTPTPKPTPTPTPVSQSDTAALMYSSGTTGKSKAVVCTHRSLIAMSCLLKHVWSSHEGGGGGGGGCLDEVYLCVVPLFHMFGLSVFVCGAMAAASTVVILGKYSAEATLAAVEEYGVTRLPAVPPMVMQMVRAAKDATAKQYDLSSLREVVCSGAPLAKEYMERFSKFYSQITLSQCYGLTETNGPITLCDGIEGRFHVSIGRLIPSLEAKIVDICTRKSLPPRKCGELLVRGPPVMQGYFKNREATCLAIDEEGWLHTGDLCFIDSLGLVYVVDRIKELIKYKAYQVAPAELEEILCSHSDIVDAAVIPCRDEEAGEIPMACVVTSKGSNLQEEDIIKFVAEKVAPYKKIRKVVMVDSIPRSPSGKILRRHLRASAAHPRLEISPRL